MKSTLTSTCHSPLWALPSRCQTTRHDAILGAGVTGHGSAQHLGVTCRFGAQPPKPNLQPQPDTALPATAASELSSQRTGCSFAVQMQGAMNALHVNQYIIRVAKI